MEYYSAIKNNEILPYGTTSKGIMLRETSDKDKCHSLRHPGTQRLPALLLGPCGWGCRLNCPEGLR